VFFKFKLFTIYASSLSSILKLSRVKSLANEILGFVRYVRVQQDGNANFLQMREVQVFDQNGVNRALPKLSCTDRCSSRYIRGEFCSGTYNHNGKYYGGCTFAGSRTDCESSCISSGYGGSLTLKSGETETEVQACKFGCGNRAATAYQSSTNTYNNVQLPASNAVDDELIGVKNMGSMSGYTTGECQISTSLFPFMSCSVL
jgi:hypothetical protein